ncbi:MAG TPA: hypothetical protein VG984_01145 [Candidatus Paceibacterota bacterium]|nr:hypothetical protein [Candidatus Paceibacterota bacterium]
MADDTPKPQALPQEFRHTLEAHAVRCRTVSAATFSWRNLDEGVRKPIAKHLATLAQTHQNGHFIPLRKAMKDAGMSSDDFIFLASRENFDSIDPVFEQAIIYLALYYSKITGQFSIDNFVPNYTEANRF